VLTAKSTSDEVAAQYFESAVKSQPEVRSPQKVKFILSASSSSETCLLLHQFSYQQLGSPLLAVGQLRLVSKYLGKRTFGLRSLHLGGLRFPLPFNREYRAYSQLNISCLRLLQQASAYYPGDDPECLGINHSVCRIYLQRNDTGLCGCFEPETLLRWIALLKFTEITS